MSNPTSGARRRRPARRAKHAVRKVVAIAATVVAFALLLHARGAAAAPGVTYSCPAPAPGTAVHWVGPGESFSSLGAAIQSAASGDTICVRAGTYVNDFATIPGGKDLTIVGVGGFAHLRQTTGDTHDGKAILTIGGNVTLKGIEFSGATVPHANGAGIRWEGGNLTIEGSYFHNNQNGILGGGNKLVVTDTKFVENGRGDGFTHGMYVLGNEVYVDRSYFEATHVGHHLKSLSAKTVVTNSTFEDGVGGDNKTPSYSIDLQRGGVGIIRNNTFVQRPQGENFVIINYGDLGLQFAQNDLQIAENTVRNQRSGGVLLFNHTTITPVVADNKIVGLPAENIIWGGPTSFQNQTVTPPPPRPTSPPTLAMVDDFAGGLVFTGGTQSAHGIQGNSGMTALGSTIYLANRHFGVGVLDRATGTSTLYHGPQGIEALGNDGVYLLAATFDVDEVLRMSSDGTVIGSITLQATDRLGITGVDSDGARLFVGSYFDGNVHVYDMNGVLLDLIETGIGEGVLSGLSYDRGDGTLWLTAGFGDGTIWHFDQQGALLGVFNLFATTLGGAADERPMLFMAAAEIPDPPAVAAPGAAAIFGLGVVGMLRRRRAPAPAR